MTSGFRTAASVSVRDDRVSALLQERASFVGDAEAVCAIGEWAAGTVHDWGIVRDADRVQRVALAQTAWLTANSHPQAPIEARLSFQVDRRELTIVIADAGTALPTGARGNDVNLHIRGRLSAYARSCEGGRELVCAMRTYPDWCIRLTWLAQAVGGPGHPPLTYDFCGTRDEAVDRARSLLRGQAHSVPAAALLAVHIQAPEQAADDVWELVGPLAATETSPPGLGQQRQNSGAGDCPASPARRLSVLTAELAAALFPFRSGCA